MRAVIILLCSGLLLGACASRSNDNRPGRAFGYEGANQLFMSGEYEQAHAGFVCIARQGSGYELAWQSAGLASFAQADVAPDEEAAELIERGLEEFTRAANAGWSASQAELVFRFVALGDEEALRQAAYWLAVYRANPRDDALGLQRFTAREIRGIEAAIGSERLDNGRMEAESFRLQPLVTYEPSETCRPWLAMRGRPRPERPRPSEDVEQRRRG